MIDDTEDDEEDDGNSSNKEIVQNTQHVYSPAHELASIAEHPNTSCPPHPSEFVETLIDEYKSEDLVSKETFRMRSRKVTIVRFTCVSLYECFLLKDMENAIIVL